MFMRRNGVESNRSRRYTISPASAQSAPPPARTSARRARTAIEVSVLVAAYLLGGTIGLGTVVFAFGIGPVVQVFLGIFDREGRVSHRRELRILEESPGSLGE